MTHIEEARKEALMLEGTSRSHPAYQQFALRGILHALIAIHDQSAPIGTVVTTNAASAETVAAAVKRTPRAPRTTPKDSK